MTLHSSFPLSWLVSQFLPLKNIRTAWCCHHHASGRDGIGLVMSGAWFPPNMMPDIHAKEFNLCLIRPDNFVSHGLRVLQVHFGKFPAGCHVPFTKEWLPSGHSMIQAWLVDCCRDGCPSGRFSTEERWSSDRVTIGFLVTSLTKALLPRSLSGSELLTFTDDGGHCAHWDLQSSRIFSVPFPWFVPQVNPVSEVYRQFLSLYAWFVALTCTVNCGTLYRQVCAFPINWIYHRWTPIKL